MRLIVLCAAFVVSSHLPGVAQTACLKVMEDQIAEGRLESVRIRIPEYKRTDQVFMLQLAASTCLDVADKEDEVEPTKRIHVFGADDGVNKRMRGFIGKTVRIHGEPFGQHTSHHHAPIVMKVTRIESLAKP
jgi:hypothetical protein